MFQDRIEAGRNLSSKLIEFQSKNPIVLALPRGGVVIGAQISKALNCPLNVIIVRKLGSPYNPEFGIGAISEGNVTVLNTDTINSLGISKQDLYKVVIQEQEELDRRLALYRQTPLPDLKDKTVILTDDGLATGVTARAGIRAVKKLNPKFLIFAVPICAKQAEIDLKKEVDLLVCLETSTELHSIGSFYQNFDQVTDKKVIELLNAQN